MVPLVLQITFPVLQNITPKGNNFTGHYYVINLNLKAERFEVMDSWRNDNDPDLIKDSANIIGSIKGIWANNYKESNVQIQKFKTVFIEVPKQTSG